MNTINEKQDGPLLAYEKYLEAGAFRLQVCEACERQVFYPRSICPNCGSGAMRWETASGKGRIYSCTTVRRRPEKGGDYNVSIIDLAEGARMMSRVDDIAPHDVRIGMAVTARILDEGGRPLVVVYPSEGEQG